MPPESTDPLQIFNEIDVREGFDARFGTRTGAVFHGDLSRPWHVPVFPTIFGEAMAKLPLRHEEFVFLDIGSGMGRAVMLASDFPFKRCIGLEIDPTYHEEALRNLSIYRSESQRCRELSSACADVMTYAFPKDDLVVWFNNSFGPGPAGAKLTAAFLEHLRQAMKVSPRRVAFVYIEPDHADLVAALGLFHPFGHPDELGKSRILESATLPGRPPARHFPFAIYANF